jgi:peptide/nickel transport system permease protein
VSELPETPDEHDSIPLLLARPSHPPAPPSTGKLARTARSRKLKIRAPGAVRNAFPQVARTKLGAAGLLAAAFLVFIGVFADLLASDLPIACKVHGRVYLFPNVTHPAELEGRVAERDAEWSIRPLVAHGPREIVPEVLAAPGGAHPLGTDNAGRDVFARVVHGTRSYLVFAFFAVAASIALGALLGGVGGMLGGGTDAVLGRAIETVSAFPPLVFVLGVQAAVPRPTLLTLFLAIAVTRWPEVARLVRAEVMAAETREYVMAARALGASPIRVLRRHIAPNVRGPLIVATALGISAVVLTEASLDFLRVGTPAGAASWGETMSEFRDAPYAWWLLAFPGMLLVATVIGHNLVGEALRDALDPRAR